MAYDITRLKADLEGTLHGTTLNQITNLDGVIDRAARQLLLDVDPQETKRIVEFANPIFAQVYDYAIPADLKGNKVVDIRPQVNRYAQDVYLQQYNQSFDLDKQLSLNNDFTINFNSAIKTIRINSPYLQQGILINLASSVTGDGTWVTSGGAQNLTTDNVNFVSGGGSLKFDLAAGQPNGSLFNSTFPAVNLNNHLNQSTLFLFTYLPTASSISSVELQWGTDSTNFFTRTVSVTQQNTVFQNGWNLLAFNWAGATVVGAPNAASIGFLQVVWSYNSTLQTGVRLNNIISRLGTILELEYYSKFLFRDFLTNAFQETVTNDSNLINLDTESYNLLFYQVALMCVQQVFGQDSSYDTNYFVTNYNEALERYKSMYKSEVQKPQSSYYPIPRRGFARFINGSSWTNY